MSFLNQIEKSSKYAPKQLLQNIKRDTRSVTGSNIRNILLHTEKDSIEEVTASEIDKLKYHELNKEENWKVDVILELTDVKFKQATIEGFTDDEIGEILDFVCTS